MTNPTPDENKNKLAVTCPNCKTHFMEDIKLVRKWILEEGKKKAQKEFLDWLEQFAKMYFDLKEEEYEYPYESEQHNIIHKKIEELNQAVGK